MELQKTSMHNGKPLLTMHQQKNCIVIWEHENLQKMPEEVQTSTIEIVLQELINRQLIKEALAM